MIHLCDGQYEMHSCRGFFPHSSPAGHTKVTLFEARLPALSVISSFTQGWFDRASSVQLPPLISSLCSWKATLMSQIFTASSGEPSIESVTLWLLFVHRGRLCNYEFFMTNIRVCFLQQVIHAYSGTFQWDTLWWLLTWIFKYRSLNWSLKVIKINVYTAKYSAN